MGYRKKSVYGADAELADGRRPARTLRSSSAATARPFSTLTQRSITVPVSTINSTITMAIRES